MKDRNPGIVLRKVRNMKTRSLRKQPQHLPKVLKKEPPTTKLVYVYLKGRGEVDYSTYSLGDALGITPKQVNKAMQSLRAIGLLEYEGKPKGTTKYTALTVPKE